MERQAAINVLFMSHCDKVCVSTRRLDFCLVLGSFFPRKGQKLLQIGGRPTLFSLFPGRADMKRHSCWTEYILNERSVGFITCMIVSHGCRYSMMRKARKQTDNSAFAVDVWGQRSDSKNLDHY